jgi:ABC-type sugar transport system permease subunit/ABC-type glycerol-3-phosphate transport system substrate-binding protein
MLFFAASLPFLRSRATRWAVAVVLSLSWLCGRGTARAESASAAARVHVTYWEKWTGFEREAMRVLVDDFNRSQQRIFVDYMAVSAVSKKTLVATAGGNPPDLAGVVAQEVFNFADKQALTPLDDFARGTNVSAERYLPAYWDMGEYEGRLYGVVSVPAVNALHWNKRLFRAAGLDPERPPKTIAELDRFAKRLTRVEDGRIVQAGFLPSDPTWWAFFWPYFFHGRLWDGGARITLTEAENVRAFTWVQSYAKEHGVLALQNLSATFGNVASAQDPFLSEKLAMVLQGVWLANYAEVLAPKLEWGAAPFPSVNADDPPVSFVDADMLVIPRGAAHPREAFEFIRFLSEQANTEKLCLLQRKNSPLREVSSSFFEQHKNPYIRMFQALPSSPGARAPLKMGVWTEYRTELHATFQKVWLQQASPEEALAETNARMQLAWDRLRRRRAIPESPGLLDAPIWLTGALGAAIAILIAREYARRRRLGSSQRAELRALARGLAFLSPWVIGLGVFVAYPVLSSIIYSLCDYSLLSAPRFVGLANYVDLFHDDLFFISLKNTAIYALFSLPLHLVAAFSLALFLDANVRGSGIYRTLVFLPSLTPVVASAMVWLWIFNARFGVLNYVLGKLSFGLIGPVPWLSNPHTALPSLILMSVWGIGHAVVITLAAMQDVPSAVYEAADIDGATLWQRVWHITLPLTSPVVYFNGILGLIGALQVFAQPYIMTQGGPARATLSYSMRLYDNAFTYLRMGYAAAMAWILFVIILGLTVLALRVGKNRVHYTAS